MESSSYEGESMYGWMDGKGGGAAKGGDQNKSTLKILKEGCSRGSLLKR